MSAIDFDPGDTPTVGQTPPGRPGTQPLTPPSERNSYSPPPGGPAQRSTSLPPGTGQLNPAALEKHERLTAQDRQRLLRDLSSTGSLRRSIKVDQAPLTIKQFLRGEVDLNTELARRFANSPLLTTIARDPEDARPASRSTAMLASQDGSAALTFDLLADQDATELTFTMNHMLALRFRLENLSSYDKRRWVDLMRRDGGVAFLWTARRWEDDYAIFVLRPHYTRLYAFSPQRFEASLRITHQVTRQLVSWLDMRWAVPN